MFDSTSVSVFGGLLLFTGFVVLVGIGLSVLYIIIIRKQTKVETPDGVDYFEGWYIQKKPLIINAAEAKRHCPDIVHGAVDRIAGENSIVYYASTNKNTLAVPDSEYQKVCVMSEKAYNNLKEGRIADADGRSHMNIHVDALYWA